MGPSNGFIRKLNDSCITLALQRVRPSLTAQTHLCKDGSSSLSCSGSLVLGITPMMVLFSEVPFSSLLLTNCMFLAVSTLILMVEPGNSTPSWVHNKGSRLGIWIPLLDDILQGKRLKFKTTNRSKLRCKERLHRMTNWDKWKQDGSWNYGKCSRTILVCCANGNAYFLWNPAECSQMYTVFSLFVVCLLKYAFGTHLQNQERTGKIWDCRKRRPGSI